MEKYLKVEVFNTKFREALEQTCNLLSDIFQSESKFPTKKDIPFLKSIIPNIWYGIAETRYLLNKDNIEVTDFKKFLVELSIIRKEDIIFRSGEEQLFYIPLFEDGIVLLR